MEEVGSELQAWRRTTRYQPTQEDREALQRCRSAQANLQSLGSLAGLGLGMLLFAGGSPVSRALSFDRLSGPVRGVGIFAPMIMGSAMANYKAQKDCLKTMLPLQTPLGQQARLLLRKHDPASPLARRYPAEGGSDLYERVYGEEGEMAPDDAPFSNEPPYASSVSSAMYATNQPSSSRAADLVEDTMPHHRQSPRDKESHQADHDNAPASTVAMRKAQLQRAQSRRKLAEAEAKNDAHGIDEHESEIEANTYPSVVPGQAPVARQIPHGEQAEESSEAARRRRVKEALERRKAHARGNRSPDSYDE